MANDPNIETFFDHDTETASYLIYDSKGGHSAILDSVLDYDPVAVRTSTTSADAIIARIKELGLTNLYILETHAHADHISAAAYLKPAVGGLSAIGAGITQTQEIFKGLFNLGDDVPTDGSQFDTLFDDGEVFTIGALSVTVLSTPGHTPACVSYHVGNCVFVGDTLFQPDFGTARCDFPGGDAATLFRSIQKILSLPPETRLFTCHDYAPGGREYAMESTVGSQKSANIHVNDQVSEQEFVAMRSTRDATLQAPRLLLPAIQINIRAGNMPEPEDNSVSYLKLPLNQI